MFCTNCGYQIPDDPRFCENCGSGVQTKTPLPPLRQEPQKSTVQNSVEEEPHAENPKRSKMPGFVPKVFIFAVIAVGVWFLKSFLDDGEPVTYAPNQIQPPVQTTQQHSVQANSPPVQTEAPPVQEDTGEDAVRGIQDIGEISEDDVDIIIERLSTYDRPTLEEFDWYDEVFHNGVWPDAMQVTEPPYLLGGWKCYIVYDSYASTGFEMQELANVDLSIESDTAVALVDWYQMFWNGEPPYDETGMGDTEFVGSYEDGAFQLTGPGNLSIGPFYEYQGNYYGFGTMLTPDGITADFWLMR